MQGKRLLLCFRSDPSFAHFEGRGKPSFPSSAQGTPGLLLAIQPTRLDSCMQGAQRYDTAHALIFGGHQVHPRNVQEPTMFRLHPSDDRGPMPYWKSNNHRMPLNPLSIIFFFSVFSSSRKRVCMWSQPQPTWLLLSQEVSIESWL